MPTVQPLLNPTLGSVDFNPLVWLSFSTDRLVSKQLHARPSPRTNLGTSNTWAFIINEISRTFSIGSPLLLLDHLLV